MRSDAARNQTRILEVARRLIAERGSTVPMDAIAAEAGVAVGTLYRHHPTKAALIEAVVRDSIESLATAADEANARVAAGGDATEELAALFRLAADRYALDRAVKEAAAAIGGGQLTPGHELPPLPPGSPEARAWDGIVVLLAAARRQGGVRADLTPADLLVLLAGVPGADASAEARDRYVELVLTGVRATSPSRTGTPAPAAGRTRAPTPPAEAAAASTPARRRGRAASARPAGRAR